MVPVNVPVFTGKTSYATCSSTYDKKRKHNFKPSKGNKTRVNCKQREGFPQNPQRESALKPAASN
jgi:hypothetical protein